MARPKPLWTTFCLAVAGVTTARATSSPRACVAIANGVRARCEASQRSSRRHYESFVDARATLGVEGFQSTGMSIAPLLSMTKKHTEKTHRHTKKTHKEAEISTIAPVAHEETHEEPGDSWPELDTPSQETPIEAAEKPQPEPEPEPEPVQEPEPSPLPPLVVPEPQQASETPIPPPSHPKRNSRNTGLVPFARGGMAAHRWGRATGKCSTVSRRQKKVA